MRVNITLNDELLSKIDTYAKSNYMNRSSVVSFACNQFLLQNELQSLLIDVKRAMQKIADTGSVTQEQLNQLEKVVTICELFNVQE